MSELIGLTGASLAGYAYLPQITHLIREQCSAGISRSAFTIWLLASVLMTVHAILLPAVVFIALGAIQIGAITTILIYSARYRGLVCSHPPTEPRLRLSSAGAASTTPGRSAAGWGKPPIADGAITGDYPSMPNRARTAVTDNLAKCRYEIRVDGQVAGFANYRVDGDRQVLFDTQVDPLHRGKGLGQRLADAALQDVRAQGRTVEARCEFIADYIREHPEHLDLVAGSTDQDPRPVA